MRKSVTVVAGLMLGLAILAGCDKKSETKSAGGGAAESGEAGESTGRNLGTETISGYSVVVTQQSDFKPGGKTKFFIKPTGGAGEPTAVRAWYGAESGEGSLKVKAGFDAADNDYDAVVEIPATPAADAKLWVEIEAGGAKNHAGFSVPK